MSDTYDEETGEVVPDKRLRHWAPLSITDPANTKPFQRQGGFKGTATRPVWTQMRLTMHFGPVGIGWGMGEPKFEVVSAGDELLVFCTLRCWYRDDNGERAEVYGVGGDKVMVKRQSGTMTDDEAFKKAYTDALGNAFVKVGVSADIHMGLFEDSKYVAWAREQSEHRPEVDMTQAPPQTPPAPRTAQESRPAPRGTTRAEMLAGAPQNAANGSTEAELKKRHRELAAIIADEQSIPGLNGIPKMPAWTTYRKMCVEHKGEGFAAETMRLLEDRIERRRQSLDVGQDYEV